MNKRIANLMLEAGKTIPGDKHIDADFCKKFAELIVRECADLNFRRTGFVTSEGESTISDMIKRHFGVEE